jgi:hypothetical protein
VALIGAVATDEAYRGHGFASELVTVATQWAVTRGAAVAFLWGSEHALYQRLGFELCGSQILVPLLNIKAPEYPCHTGWNPSLMKLLEKRAGGMELRAEDFRWITAHRGVRWVWSSTPSGEPLAYAAIGRGIDLSGIIHEWGGEKNALLALFSSLKKTDPELKILGSRRILESYGISCAGLTQENLCLAKVMDPSQVIHWADPEFETPIDPENDGFRLGGPSGVWLSERDWARELFGTQKAPSVLPNLLPVPLWIWGLDAV